MATQKTNVLDDESTINKDDSKPICIREVNENLRRVDLDMELTRPLAQLNTNCQFKKKYYEWCIRREKAIEQANRQPKPILTKEEKRLRLNERAKKYRNNHKEKYREISRRYYMDNIKNNPERKEKLRIYQQKLRDKLKNNPEKLEEKKRKQREYYYKIKNNPEMYEKLLNYNLEKKKKYYSTEEGILNRRKTYKNYRERNREKINQNSKEYYYKNKDRILARQNAYNKNKSKNTMEVKQNEKTKMSILH